jgi:hypothetical protein
LEAVEPTVLNCFLFRQTDLISGGAAWKETAPLDLNQQHSAGKIKASLHRYSTGHKPSADHLEMPHCLAIQKIVLGATRKPTRATHYR